jgi:2-iminobutanoate/2-iminopropanoate deaminase
MSNIFLNPSDLPAPVGPYSQAVLSDGPGQWLSLAGQVGTETDGSIPEDAAAQAELAWTNVARALAAAGMGMEHLVKTTLYVVDRADLPALREVRLRHLGPHRPASTLVLVSGLVDARLTFEVEALAFRPSTAG